MKKAIQIVPIVLFSFSLLCRASVAQTTPDTTLGAESSIATPDVEINGINSDRIDGGACSIDSTAGNIEIHATGAINLTGASMIANTVLPGAVGHGGSIDISTGSLSVADSSQLIAITYGQGNAGSVNINAHDAVSFDGAGGSGYTSGGINTTSIFTGVLPTAIGDSGSINITAKKWFDLLDKYACLPIQQITSFDRSYFG